MRIENSSMHHIKGGLFGPVEWNTDLSKAPLDTPVLTTVQYTRNSGSRQGGFGIEINNRTEMGWWSYEAKPIAWSPIPIYVPEGEQIESPCTETI